MDRGQQQQQHHHYQQHHHQQQGEKGDTDGVKTAGDEAVKQADGQQQSRLGEGHEGVATEAGAVLEVEDERVGRQQSGHERRELRHEVHEAAKLNMPLPELLGVKLDALVWLPNADESWQGGFVDIDTSNVEPVELAGCERKTSNFSTEMKG